MRLALGREAGDQVGADGDIGAAGLQPLDQVHRIGAQMAALHALEDQVVRRAAARGAGAASRALRWRTGRTAADRSRPRRARTCAGGAIAETRRGSRATSAPSGGLPGRSWPQLVTSTPVSTTSGAPWSRCRSTSRSTCGDGQRAAWSATLRDDAEGAGMVATVLHRDEGAGVAAAAAGCTAAGTFQRARRALAVLGTRPSTSGMAASWSRSISAAQPVTSRRASGRARRALRIACRVWRTASDVTAQLLTTTTSPSFAKQRANAFALGDVEAAAERDDFGRDVRLAHA